MPDVIRRRSRRGFFSRALRGLAEGGADLGVKAQGSLDDPIGDLLHLNLELHRLKVSLPEPKNYEN